MHSRIFVINDMVDEEELYNNKNDMTIDYIDERDTLDFWDDIARFNDNNKIMQITDDKDLIVNEARVNDYLMNNYAKISIIMQNITDVKSFCKSFWDLKDLFTPYGETKFYVDGNMYDTLEFLVNWYSINTGGYSDTFDSNYTKMKIVQIFDYHC